MIESERPVPAGRFALGVSALDIPRRERGRVGTVYVADDLTRDPTECRVEPPHPIESNSIGTVSDTYKCIYVLVTGQLGIVFAPCPV